MKKLFVFITIIGFILFGIQACTKKKFAQLDENNEVLSGGMQTVFDEGSGAYGHMFAGMNSRLQSVHEVGDLAFEQTFVSAPANMHGGLGPIYNNVSCVSCHIGDGRGKVPGIGESAASILFRISQAGTNTHGGPLPIQGFGDQIQHRSIIGVLPEANVNISYSEKTYQFDDGEVYSLRSPTYTLSELYQSIIPGYNLSPRVAMPVFGLGLLEAVSETDLLNNTDEFDGNKDGISGKANYVWNVLEQKATIGKFGWKANQPSLLQQVAAAYNGDMGITTFLFPTESSFGQIQYDGLQDDVELSDSLLYSTVFYIQTLGVPARRNVTNTIVKQGKQLFMDAGCGACHLPNLRTSTNVAFPAISNQQIHPYTDMLLHDMGAELADFRSDFMATGFEWRTSPLWGIGLTKKVNGHTNFLHDGRARNLLEAIMWHGGEAVKSVQKVKAYNKNEREALLKFLESL